MAPNTYVCLYDPPFLLTTNESGRVEVKMYWDALRITYVLDSTEYLRIETPFITLTIDSDRVINHVLNIISSLFSSGKCFEVEPEVFKS